MPPLPDLASMDPSGADVTASASVIFASVAILVITVVFMMMAAGDDPPRQRTTGGAKSTLDGLDSAIKHLDAFTTSTRKYGKPWMQVEPAILADDVLWLEFGHYIVNHTELKVNAATNPRTHELKLTQTPTLSLTQTHLFTHAPIRVCYCLVCVHAVSCVCV